MAVSADEFQFPLASVEMSVTADVDSHRAAGAAFAAQCAEGSARRSAVGRES